MEKDIHTIMELVGNKHKFTIFIIAMNLFIWINTSVLNYSLPFIEAKPKVTYIKDNKEVTSKLDYDICDQYDYIIKEDYKYSIITDFEDGTECNKLKNSIIGTINSIGVLLGNFLFHILSERFGYKNLLFFFHLGHALFLVISVFYDNYYYFQVINLFVMFFTKSLLNSSLVINNEIIDMKYKALISSFVNSGLGIGGLFYVLMFYLLKNWRYVYILGACLSVLTAIIIKIFYHDALFQSLIDKDYDKFYGDILYIAKKNGREKEFLEGIAQDEKYKNCMQKLKEYTLKDGEKGKDIEKIEKENEKQKENNGKENEKNAQIILIENQPKINVLKTEEEFIDRNKDENKKIEQKENTSDNNKRQIKGSLFQIFKYSSVRYILIILSIGWFCNSTLFYGLVLGIKTLKGNQYRNTALLYLCDFAAYNVSGFFSNSRLGRRLSLQIFTLGYGIFSLVMFLVYDKNQDIVVGFYFCARLAMICGFCVYYSFAFESFPLSVAAYGYTFSATFSSIAGVIIPFIIEYIKDKYVFLIYAIEGIACAGIFFFLEETRGKPRADNIKEIEEEMNKEKGDKEKGDKEKV